MHKPGGTLPDHTDINGKGSCLMRPPNASYPSLGQESLGRSQSVDPTMNEERGGGVLQSSSWKVEVTAAASRKSHREPISGGWPRALWQSHVRRRQGSLLELSWSE